MKIKTKKVMTEKEYLHYVIDKTDFLSISHDFTHIDHDIVHSDIVLELHDHNNVTCAKTWVDSEGETAFEAEIEEEITLTTPLPSMLHVWETEVLGREMKEVENKSIASQYTGCSTEFWLKEDNKMTLIWRDGEMVE